MNCQFLIGICSKTRLPCPHCSVDGGCDEAECLNAVVPTWKELADIYVAAFNPTKSRESNIRCGVADFACALGVDLSEKVGVSDEQMDMAYSKLIERYSPYTVESIFSSVMACISARREIQREYRRLGKVAPKLLFPSVQRPCLEPTVLTPEQRVNLNQVMSILRSSTLPVDRRRYVWLWFAWRVGMRPSDIRRVTWKCITIRSNGIPWLDYVPHKTSGSTGGRKAGGQIPEEQYLELKPFIGDPNEPVIPKFANRIPKSGCVKIKHGENISACQSITNWVIDLMRKKIGVIDKKPAYVLRKDCASIITATYGPIRAAQMLGDNVAMLLKHYVDIHKTALKDGL